MSKYLYGAAVQGIQGFIFQTNELKDIVGASELVQKICTDLFYMENPKEKDDCLFGGKDIPKDDIIINAAGNIKCILDKEHCQRAVREFPKKVMEAAPGITISQAVVKFDEDEEKNNPEYFKKQVDELEEKLRAQRNKPAKSLTIGLMGIERSRKTGLPATEENKGEYSDEGTVKKKDKADTAKLSCLSFGITEDKAKGLNPHLAHNIEDMTWRNDWIAIIHADGNGLGEIVRAIGNDKKKFSEFSKKLTEKTVAAANRTFKDIVEKFKTGEDEDKGWNSKKNPMRPVVLSGDDMTMICRGDIAMDYATKFLQYFEEETKDIAEDKDHNKYSLTACAGIAYIKSSYPFYYGYNLAEALCSRAKKDAKSKKMIDLYNPKSEEDKKNKKVPSCLMFHKVQSSFVEEYDEIVKKELMTDNGAHRFDFGPYYLNKPEGNEEYNERWTIKELLNATSKLSKSNDKDGNAVKSCLRQWMTAMHNEEAQAEQLKKRAEYIISNTDLNKLFKKLTDTKCKEWEREIGKDENEKPVKAQFYPVYDVLSLLTVNEQEIKEKKGGKA